MSASKYRFTKADFHPRPDGRVWFRIERVETLGSANSFENAKLIVDALNRREEYEAKLATMEEPGANVDRDRRRIIALLNHQLTCYTGWCDGKVRHVINYIIRHIVNAT